MTSDMEDMEKWLAGKVLSVMREHAEGQLKAVRKILRWGWFGALWGASWTAWCIHEALLYAQQHSDWMWFYVVMGIAHLLLALFSGRNIERARHELDIWKEELAHIQKEEAARNGN